MISETASLHHYSLASLSSRVTRVSNSSSLLSSSQRREGMPCLVVPFVVFLNEFSNLRKSSLVQDRVNFSSFWWNPFMIKRADDEESWYGWDFFQWSSNNLDILTKLTKNLFSCRDVFLYLWIHWKAMFVDCLLMKEVPQTVVVNPWEEDASLEVMMHIKENFHGRWVHHSSHGVFKLTSWQSLHFEILWGSDKKTKKKKTLSWELAYSFPILQTQQISLEFLVLLAPRKEHTQGERDFPEHYEWTDLASLTFDLLISINSCLVLLVSFLKLLKNEKAIIIEKQKAEVVREEYRSSRSEQEVIVESTAI